MGRGQPQAGAYARRARTESTAPSNGTPGAHMHIKYRAQACAGHRWQENRDDLGAKCSRMERLLAAQPSTPTGRPPRLRPQQADSALITLSSTGAAPRRPTGAVPRGQGGKATRATRCDGTGVKALRVAWGRTRGRSRGRQAREHAWMRLPQSSRVWSAW